MGKFNLTSKYMCTPLALSIASILSVSSMGLAYAEEAAKQEPEAAKNASALEVIMITAQRRSQNLQEASVSIAAINGEGLESRGITDSTDLNGVVPGLKLNYVGGQIQTFVRGVGDTSANAYTQASVSVNVDGVYLARSSAFRSIFFDIDRVEVLRGPQGTLYGRNSSGGAINVLTKNPEIGETNGYFNLDVGNYNMTKMQGALNLPLNDNWAMRVSSQIVDRDGFNSDGSSDNKSKAARVKLLYSPDENFSVNTSIETSKISGIGPGRVNRPIQFGDPWEGTTDKRITSENYPSLTNRPDPAYMDTEYFSLTSELEWDLGHSVLNIIPAYKALKIDSLAVSRTYFKEIDDSKQYSFEARLSGDNEDFNWVTGLFWFEEELSIFIENDSRNFATQSGRYQLQDANENGTESYAIFAESTININEDLRAVLGARYTEETRDKKGIISNYVYTNGMAPAPTIVDLDNELKVDKVTWRLGAEYDLSDDTMAYATVNYGFKSGGFTATGDDPFFPEYVTAFTLGSKSVLLDGQLTLNLELFKWDYKDQQVSFLGQDNNGAVTFTTRNAGKSTIQGLSSEIAYQVNEDIRVDFGIEYLDATFDDFTYETTGDLGVPSGEARADGCLNAGTGALPFLRVRDCSGKNLPHTPKWSGNARYTQYFPMESGAEWVFAADVKFSAEHYLTAANFSSENQQQDAYALFDASLTYEDSSDMWSIQFYVQNIGDKAVYLQASDNSFIEPLGGPERSSVAAINSPRTYGARLKYSF